METLFIFLIKSSGLIGVFYLSYIILLRKETFFNSNRWYLLVGLITSALLPLLFFTKTVWIDPMPTNLDWPNIPLTTTTTILHTTTTPTIQNDTFGINWNLAFAIVYLGGIAGSLLKFAFDFYSLSKILKGRNIQKQADFKFIDITENISPFSYFNSIVYNSSLYSASEMESILEHEKVHSEQYHTVDVLITRFFCILFWFNPFIWLYKKAVLQNLEFIADSEATKNISDKKTYQLTLLKITTQANCVAITNHFYQSLIKKRIVMLNKNQSNKRNTWKFAAVLPLLGAFLFFFQVKVVAQEKETSTEKKETQSDKIEMEAIKNENDSDTLSKEKEIGITSKKDKKNIDKTDVNTIENPVNITTKTEEPIRFYLKDYYIDGKKSTAFIYSKLDINKIGKVETSRFEKKVRVTTKTPDKLTQTNISEENTDNNATAKVDTEHKTANLKDFIKTFNRALVIVDGKESNLENLLNIKNKKFKFTNANVFEESTDETKKIVLATYGEKARNGLLVVEISPIEKE